MGRDLYYTIGHAQELVRQIRSAMQQGDAPKFIRYYGTRAARYLDILSEVYWPYSDEYISDEETE